VRNICTKNYQNLLISFQVTVENVRHPFLRHGVHHITFRRSSNCFIFDETSSVLPASLLAAAACPDDLRRSARQHLHAPNYQQITPQSALTLNDE